MIHRSEECCRQGGDGLLVAAESAVLPARLHHLPRDLQRVGLLRDTTESGRLSRMCYQSCLRCVYKLLDSLTVVSLPAPQAWPAKVIVEYHKHEVDRDCFQYICGICWRTMANADNLVDKAMGDNCMCTA